MTVNISYRNLFTLACFLTALTLAAAGCAPQSAITTLAAEASITSIPSQTPAPTTTQIPTATPTPIIEPALPPSQSADPLAVSPPRNLDLALAEQADDGDFGLVDAHAVYAYYRAEVGPSMWASDAEFIEAMETYATSLEAQGIDLYQASDADGTTYSMLVDGTSILLNFNVQSGALTFADPGYWSSDSEPRWINAGGPVDLVVGPDNHAYVVRLDSEGNVVAWLNTFGATLDNINNQWIEVRDGQSIMDWDPASRTFVENPLFTVPPEWQGRIDHLETLEDGRTVAIANPEDPDQEARLRVLQLNDSGEWIAYEPHVIWSTISDEGRENLYNGQLPELIDLTSVDRVHFNNDPANPEIPLGFVGRAYFDDARQAWTNLISGAVIGFGFVQHPNGLQVMALQVQVPTATGDFVVVDLEAIREFSMGTHIYSLESLDINPHNQTFSEMELVRAVNEWGGPIRMYFVFDYFEQHQTEWLGRQIVFGLAGGDTTIPSPDALLGVAEANTTELRQQLVDYIQTGTIPAGFDGTLETSTFITFLEGWIADQTIIDDINNGT